MARLRFFGTSNANPHPGRRQSGILLDVGGSHYLFDCGDGIATALWNDPGTCLNKLHAVFFTHRHPDHVGGLYALLLLLHQRIKNSRDVQPGASTGREIPPAGPGPAGFVILIPGEQDQANLFAEMADVMHVSNAETAYAKHFFPFTGQGLIYKDALVSVASFPTHHVIDASGFVITVEGKRIIISGDILHPDVIAGAIGSDPCDVVVIENAHFPTSAIATALARSRVSTLVVTHRRDSILQDPPQAMAHLAPLAGRCKIVLADDGMVLEV